MAVPSAYRWVETCSDKCSMPKGVFIVGTDKDGAQICVGRAQHEGDLLPAKVIPSKDMCYVSRAGKEFIKDKYEVLVAAAFSWEHGSNGNVPPNAVEAGVTADGEKLYYGRVERDNEITPGKIHPSRGCCYYPLRGEEKKSNEYEVLVLKNVD